MAENSCGMMAIMHVLLNINDSLVLGPRLSGYKDFFMGVTSDIRGETIASQGDILEINNSYDNIPIQIETGETQKEVSIFHFLPNSGKSLHCVYSFYERIIRNGYSFLSHLMNRRYVEGTCCIGYYHNLPRLFLDSFDSDAEFRSALISTLQSRIQQIITDTPTTNNIAVLIVHESFTAQYKRGLERESKSIAELKKQLETGINHREKIMYRKESCI